jgi:hypothetical protein
MLLHAHNRKEAPRRRPTLRAPPRAHSTGPTIRVRDLNQQPKGHHNTMMRLIRTMLLASLALFSLALLAGSASANRSIEVEGVEARRGVTITSEGPTVFTEEGGGTERCNLTLTGTIGRLIAKNTRLPEGQIGTLTGGRTAGCIGPLGERNREAIVLAEPVVNGLRVPIPLRYNSFLGTLPRINGILIVALRPGFTIFPLGLTCLYSAAEVGALIRFTGELPRSERGSFLANVANLVRELSSGLCPARGALSSTFNIRPQLILNLR